MAQQVTADSGLLNFYKYWYTTHPVENLYFQNDPILPRIPKARINGKAYNYTLPYGRGGACSGDATKAVANIGTTSYVAEAQVKPGKIFSAFIITQSEYLSSLQAKGAYLPAAVLKMFNSTENMRKMMAACLWGYGYGDIGVISSSETALISATSITLTPDKVVKIDIGTNLQFTVGTTKLPNEAYITGGPYTVTAIAGNVVTFTPALGAAVVAGAFVEVDGGRDASTNPNMPGGILANIPIIGNRTGTPWTTWIGTSFNNVTRNAAVDRLAGWFYDGSATLAYRKTILNGDMYARRYGQANKKSILVMNDVDYLALLMELDDGPGATAIAKTTYMQEMADADSPENVGVVVGKSKVRTAFYTTWIEDIIPTPYSPPGFGFFLDPDTWELFSYSNIETPMNDGIAALQPGTQMPGDVTAPDITNYKFLIDDYLNVQPASVTSEGPGSQCLLSAYMNFACFNPAHNGAVRFY